MLEQDICGILDLLAMSVLWLGFSRFFSFEKLSSLTDLGVGVVGLFLTKVCVCVCNNARKTIMFQTHFPCIQSCIFLHSHTHTVLWAGRSCRYCTWRDNSAALRASTLWWLLVLHSALWSPGKLTALLFNRGFVLFSPQLICLQPSIESCFSHRPFHWKKQNSSKELHHMIPDSFLLHGIMRCVLDSDSALENLSFLIKIIENWVLFLTLFHWRRPE